MRHVLLFLSAMCLTFTSVDVEAQGVPKGLTPWKPTPATAVPNKDSAAVNAKPKSVVPKDSLAPSDRLYAYTRRQIRSAAEIADCIANNDTKCLRSTSQEYLRTFQRTHQHLKFKNVQDLANWVRELVVVPCPKVRTRLAALALPSRKLELRLWARMLRDGEMCLVDTNDNRIAMSMSCGNPLPDVLSYKWPVDSQKPTTVEVVKAPTDTPKVVAVAPVLRSVAISAKPLSAKLFVGDTLPATAEVVVTPDTLSTGVLWRSLDSDVATVSNSGLIRAVKPGTVSIVVTALADATRSATISITVVEKKKAGHMKRNIIGGVIALGLIYMCATDWCQTETTTVNTTVIKAGGPVNPPNNMVPWWYLVPISR